MALDNVPWMIEGNVEHSVNVARLLAYAAFNGEEGIIGTKDFEVRETAPPSPELRVFPGAGAVLNRAAGANYEAYAVRAASQTSVPIAATGSASGRTDLIVARVENPWLDGEPWADPPLDGAQDYSYFNLAVISNVGNEAPRDTIERLGYSAIALAKVTLPANTATIDQSMITDVRQMTQVRKAETFNIIAPTAERRVAVSGEWVNWPPDMNMDIEIPEWATHMQARAIIGGARFGAAGTNGGAGWNVFGALRVQFATGSFTQYSQSTSWNLSNATGEDRTTMMAGAPGIPIPEAMRGAPTSVRAEARKGGGTTDLWVDTSSMCSLEVRFTQGPESNVV